MTWWWSYALAVVGVFGLWLTTRKDWRGYVVGCSVQLLWIAYAVVTSQWGFIASAVAYGAVNSLGLYRWRFAKPNLLIPWCDVCQRTGGDPCDACPRGVAQ